MHRVAVIVESLLKAYPDAHCSLNFENPYQLLVATVLSAQCTDARVNLVTPNLFSKYPDFSDLAKAQLPELESIIRSTGFYKNKAKNLVGAAVAVQERHGGKIPRTVEELSALPGVGRKTANVVLGNAFGVPSMVVDTHVTRLVNRMGFVKGQDAVKLESELEVLVEKKHWTIFSHLLIQHGRLVCVARNPSCESCFLRELCPKLSYSKK